MLTIAVTVVISHAYRESDEARGSTATGPDNLTPTGPRASRGGASPAACASRYAQMTSPQPTEQRSRRGQPAVGAGCAGRGDPRRRVRDERRQLRRHPAARPDQNGQRRVEVGGPIGGAGQLPRTDPLDVPVGLLDDPPDGRRPGAQVEAGQRGVAASGTCPPRYRCTMLTTRLTRLPSPLARSSSARATSLPTVKSVSPTRGTSRSSHQRTASVPYRSTSSSGSTP